MLMVEKALVISELLHFFVVLTIFKKHKGKNPKSNSHQDLR